MSLDDWSRPLGANERVLSCADDAELAERSGDHVVVHAASGDVHRSLGEPARQRVTTAVSLDLIDCRVNHGRFRAAAHVLCRPVGSLSRWTGPITVVMVSGHIGRYEAAPRAHPGDGLLDVVEVSDAMPLRQRWMALRRSRTGTHLPHPHISMTRVRDLRRSYEQPMQVVIDGRPVGVTTHLDVAVIAAAYEFAV